MICYKDMTFCTFFKDCADAKKCHRPLTKKVQEDADKWWEDWNIPGGAPIAQYTKKPVCHVKKVKTTKRVYGSTQRKKK